MSIRPLFVSQFLHWLEGGKYLSCPMSASIEVRDLVIATCDTEKKIQATKVWNVTSSHLRDEGADIPGNFDLRFHRFHKIL